MKVVLDTSVLVAAARSQLGASYAILQQLPSPLFQICLSVSLYHEWLAVLSRPENLPPGQTPDDALKYYPMTTHTLQIPDGVLRAIKETANEAGVSVDQFLSSAASEKLASWKSLDWLRNEAAKANRSDFEHFLGAVPKTDPVPSDEL